MDHSGIRNLLRNNKEAWGSLVDVVQGIPYISGLMFFSECGHRFLLVWPSDVVVFEARGAHTCLIIYIFGVQVRQKMHTRNRNSNLLI
jgi:hypothetical protein